MSTNRLKEALLRHAPLFVEGCQGDTWARVRVVRRSAIDLATTIPHLSEPDLRRLHSSCRRYPPIVLGNRPPTSLFLLPHLFSFRAWIRRIVPRDTKARSGLRTATLRIRGLGTQGAQSLYRGRVQPVTNASRAEADQWVNETFCSASTPSGPYSGPSDPWQNSTQLSRVSAASVVLVSSKSKPRSKRLSPRNPRSTPTMVGPAAWAPRSGGQT